MDIINAKFRPDELSKIYRIEPFMGNIKDLSIYNDTYGFDIVQFYNKGLVGYAVIFLGYNGLTSSDASLEDIVYWQGTPEELETFLRMVRSAQDYSLPIEDIYYDPENFDEMICSSLNRLGFKETTRVR